MKRKKPDCYEQSSFEFEPDAAMREAYKIKS